MFMISRTDRSLVAEWWWTVDRWLLAVTLLMMCLGVLLSLAASPAVAERIGVGEYHFVNRQLLYMVLSVAVLVLTSMATATQGRRIALLVACAGFVMLALTLVVGIEVKGATRWITIAGMSVQPSEFVKPAFIVLSAWLFAEATKRPDVPGNLLSIALYGLFVALLILQPDIGQTILVTAAWGMMFFMAGLSWGWIAGFGVLGSTGVVAAYLFVPHVTKRFDRFFDPSSGDSFQTDTALQAFSNGGLFGLGPGEGEIKRILPDAHSDFIFAVVAEEYGILACIVLVALFAFIVLRGLNRCLNEPDPFRRLATAGLIGMVGFQAVINMGVNVNLLPAKGMTLPFISYGGSSLISMAFAMGLVLAMTRRRPAGEMAGDHWSGPVRAAGALG
jgi:cell division protein FtsW